MPASRRTRRGGGAKTRVQKEGRAGASHVDRPLTAPKELCNPGTRARREMEVTSWARPCRSRRADPALDPAAQISHVRAGLLRDHVGARVGDLELAAKRIGPPLEDVAIAGQASPGQHRRGTGRGWRSGPLASRGLDRARAAAGGEVSSEPTRWTGAPHDGADPGTALEDTEAALPSARRPRSGEVGRSARRRVSLSPGWEDRRCSSSKHTPTGTSVKEASHALGSQPRIEKRRPVAKRTRGRGGQSSATPEDYRLGGCPADIDTSLPSGAMVTPEARRRGPWETDTGASGDTGEES